jgi:hypothetical protein
VTPDPAPTPPSPREPAPAGQSRQSLERLPGRALTFLRAVGTHPGVRAAMAAGGFGEADHREGFALLASVCAYATEDAPARGVGTRVLPVREPRERQLLALHQWYGKWAATARALIFQRRYLIALGLAEPREEA